MIASVFDSVSDMLVSGLVHGTVLAIITAILCATVLRRARPALIAALWTIVLIKFAIPLGPEVPVSVEGAFNAFVSGGGESVETYGPVTGVIATDAGTSAESSGSLWWLLLQVALLGIYMSIVAWRLGRHWSRQRAANRLAQALPLAGGDLSAVVEQCARTLRLRRVPTTRVSGTAGTPYVVGLFSPSVVVPEWLIERPAELEASLLHELAHLRRRDTWLRAVQLGVGSALFFWPVVAWVNRRIDRSREMACDHWAISRGSLSAREYARMLVAMTKRAQWPGESEPAMALLGGPRLLELRVDSVLKSRPKPRLGIASGVAVLMWAVVSLGNAAEANAQSTVDDPYCGVQPELIAQILVQHPDADIDGDGDLSRDEACALQRRIRREAVDLWFSPIPDSGLDLGVDREIYLDQLAMSLPDDAFGPDLSVPVCGNEAASIDGDVCTRDLD
jgi:beta-lactamase regulating signal transducer with metallopeptidase domain